MSNAMVIPPKPSALAKYNLPEGSQFGGGLGASMPLPVLSIRGSKFHLRKDGQEVPLKKMELDVIFVDSRPNVSKRFYGGKFVEGSTDAPTCSSADGSTPDVSAPVSASCATCPNNAWGSRISEAGKEGKACQDYKRVVVYLPGVLDTPCVLDFPATSLKKPKGDSGPNLFLREYLGLLQQHTLDPRQVVTRLEFTSVAYPQLHLRFARHARPEEVELVAAMLETPEVHEVLDRGAVEAHVPTVQVAALPELAPLDEEDEEPAPKPARVAKPRAVKPQPVQEASTDGGDDEEDDTIIADIKKLLGG